jgi:hypothetical protein
VRAAEDGESGSAAKTLRLHAAMSAAAKTGRPLAAFWLPHPAASVEMTRETPLGRIWRDARLRAAREWLDNFLDEAAAETEKDNPAAEFVWPKQPLVVTVSLLDAGEQPARPVPKIECVFWHATDDADARFAERLRRTVAGLWKNVASEFKDEASPLPTFQCRILPDDGEKFHFQRTPSITRKTILGAWFRPKELTALFSSEREADKENPPKPTWAFEEELIWEASGGDGEFEERLSVKMPAKDAEDHWAPSLGLRLLREGLRKNAGEWRTLLNALPGDGDLAFVAQAAGDAPGALRDDWLSALERRFRGKRWARRFEASPEAKAPERYAFLAQALEGAFGGACEMSLIGQPHVTLAAQLTPPTPGMPVAQHALLAGAAKLDGDFSRFRTKDDLEYFAANFKGRSLFVAPMLDFSAGMLRLYNSREALERREKATVEKKMLLKEWGKDPWVAGRLRLVERERAPEATGEEEAAAWPSFLMVLRPARVAPMAYTAWLLSPEGPMIGAWRVPGALLPPPGVFNRLTPLRWTVTPEEDGFVIRTRGPVPGLPPMLPALIEYLTIPATEAPTKP